MSSRDTTQSTAPTRRQQILELHDKLRHGGRTAGRTPVRAGVSVES